MAAAATPTVVLEEAAATAPVILSSVAVIPQVITEAVAATPPVVWGRFLQVTLKKMHSSHMCTFFK